MIKRLCLLGIMTCSLYQMNYSSLAVVSSIVQKYAQAPHALSLELTDLYDDVRTGLGYSEDDLLLPDLHVHSLHGRSTPVMRSVFTQAEMDQMALVQERQKTIESVVREVKRQLRLLLQPPMRNRRYGNGQSMAQMP